MRAYGCSTCGKPEMECGWDDKHDQRDIRVWIPLRFKTEGHPLRWYGKVTAVYCSAVCANA